MGLAATVARDADLAAHPSVLYYDDLRLDGLVYRFEQADPFPKVVPGRIEPCVLEEYGLPGVRIWNAKAERLVGWWRVVEPVSRYPEALQSYQRPYFQGPTHLFVRYLLRVGEDTLAADAYQAGKLPGMAGSYDIWSARVHPPGFNGVPKPSLHACWETRLWYGFRRADGASRLMCYFYGVRNWRGTPASMGVYYGNGDPDGPTPTDGWLIPGRTHCIEQEIKLNSLVDPKLFITDAPGQAVHPMTQCHNNAVSDGEMRVWLDGVLVCDYRTIAFRGMDAVRIQSAPWVNIYQGGHGLYPKADEHYDLGAMVAARQYIGPPKLGGTMPDTPDVVVRHKAGLIVKTVEDDGTSSAELEQLRADLAAANKRYDDLVAAVRAKAAALTAADADKDDGKELLDLIPGPG